LICHVLNDLISFAHCFQLFYDRLIQFRFYISLYTEQAILETFFGLILKKLNATEQKQATQE